MNTPFYKTYLREELARRCSANPRYSLRAFARALGMDAGGLSRVLSDRRSLSFKAARKILPQLELHGEARQRFVDSLLQDQSQQRQKALPKEWRAEATSEVREIDPNVFRVIGDWYHYAILELTFVPEFRPEPRWIARALGITPIEAKLAVERLLELGLLERRDGTLRKTEALITTADKDSTTPYLRRHQRQILEKAIASLDNDAIPERSMTGMTMAIDPRKLRLAKQMIEEFMLALCRALETGRQRRVYQLGISLYPLQKEERC